MGFSSWSAGPPTLSVVPAGSCQFGEEFHKVPLLDKIKISPNTYVFTFGVPDGKSPLDLSTCACILAKGGQDAEGNAVIRPYTPMSTNSMKGKFELMVKVYPNGVMTKYLEGLDVGAEVEFKHISFNVKLQYPFGRKKYYGMIVGGTGITPMIQALHALLGDPDDESQVSVLYGSHSQQDILAGSTLDDWTATHGDRLSVQNVLSGEPQDSDWKGERGFIDRKLVEKHFAPPGDDVLIFVCGPPVMYDIFCGPRTEKDKVTGILADIGYSADQVYKF